VDVAAVAHLLQHLRPDADADLAQVRLAQQEHHRARLADPGADGERDLVPQDRPVVRELEEVELPRELQLPPERLLRDPDPARHQLVPATRDRIPDEDVSVQPVHRATVGGHGLRRPVVVVGRPQLVREAVGERPADAVDEDRRVLLEDRGLPLLAGQVRIGGEQVLRVDELELVRQHRVTGRGERRPLLAQERVRLLQDLPDSLHGLRQVRERALLRRDRLLPVPLVDVRRVIVVEEVVLPHRSHVGQEALARLHPELP
jgi:hypothetical protein